ncbi:Signal peptidase complex subunit 3 [Trypanosoma melophagium]|uniref:Signal peptidase complex subunit 3 n=1 Tax=Trypanosoma melophagium TaxID=715481 RepID=UPI003519E200|nr:Signal peptidase complex subunit 3 [Trypanosoma melophagium]
MHSCSQRVLEITSTALSVLLVGIAVIVATSFIPLLHRTPPASSMPVISTFNMSISPLMQLSVPTIYAQEMDPPPVRDRIIPSFTFRADFSPAWDWNTKAIYVSFIARYRTDRNVLNEVTLLDAILHTREEAAHWQLAYARKYPLEDAHANTLAGVLVQVVLRYQVLRYCGYSPVYEISPSGNGESMVFRLPKKYTEMRRRN